MLAKDRMNWWVALESRRQRINLSEHIKHKTKASSYPMSTIEVLIYSIQAKASTWKLSLSHHSSRPSISIQSKCVGSAAQSTCLASHIELDKQLISIKEQAEVEAQQELEEDFKMIKEVIWFFIIRKTQSYLLKIVGLRARTLEVKANKLCTIQIAWVPTLESPHETAWILSSHYPGVRIRTIHHHNRIHRVQTSTITKDPMVLHLAPMLVPAMVQFPTKEVAES